MKPSRVSPEPDGVTFQLRRVSAGFFGPLAQTFIKKSRSSSSKSSHKNLLRQWAAIARHPEPEISLLLSFRLDRQRNLAAFKQWKKSQQKIAGRRSADAWADAWTDPIDLAQVTTWIRQQGFEPFYTFVKLGPTLEEFLLSEGRLPVVPSWEKQGRDLFKALNRGARPGGRKPQTKTPRASS